jgi:hypothetical protein
VVAELIVRVATLERAVLTLCDHVEALEQCPRVAAVLDENDQAADGNQRH